VNKTPLLGGGGLGGGEELNVILGPKLQLGPTQFGLMCDARQKLSVQKTDVLFAK
jgi:hypothetical protein